MSLMPKVIQDDVTINDQQWRVITTAFPLNDDSVLLVTQCCVFIHGYDMFPIVLPSQREHDIIELNQRGVSRLIVRVHEEYKQAVEKNNGRSSRPHTEKP
jgi:hypothetical protein